MWYDLVDMSGKRRNRTLTPIGLALVMAMPFICVPGGLALLLGLAAATVGIEPSVFISEFLADSVVTLSPLALKCIGVWAVYTALYLTLAWVYWPFYRRTFDFDILDPALSEFFDDPAGYPRRAVHSTLSVWRALLRRQTFWQGLRFSWSHGTHPQVEYE